MPSKATLPPWFISFSMSLKARLFPDISRPTSKPSCMPSSLNATSCRSSCMTFTARVTPIFRARSKRYSFTSVMTTLCAPTCLARAAPMMPIGPAPVIRTSSPTRSKERVVWVALPKGSKREATSSLTSGGKGKALLAGMHRNSAKAPWRFTPTPTVFLQRCLMPARQFRQWPQTKCPSPLTRSPTLKPSTPPPTSTTVPANSWPTVMPCGIVFCAHSSQW
mmetsp:Transcript_90431/g.282823  ORF Transcript_90431/g.282823 Transcript_90431/m.282823 type:complete len:221 (-) Transcript_90431:320-982(-)